MVTFCDGSIQLSKANFYIFFWCGIYAWSTQRNNQITTERDMDFNLIKMEACEFIEYGV